MTEYKSYYYVIPRGRYYTICSICEDIGQYQPYLIYEEAERQRQRLQIQVEKWIKSKKAIEQNEKQTRA